MSCQVYYAASAKVRASSTSAKLYLFSAQDSIWSKVKREAKPRQKPRQKPGQKPSFVLN